MASQHSVFRCALAAGLLCSAAALAQQAGPSVRIQNRIDASNLLTIRGTVHPLANALNDRGAAPDDMRLDRLQLVLHRSAGQETALRLLIDQMHTPGSPSYHKWLTPEQFGAEFGPSDQDIGTVEAWLTGQGFSIVRVNPGKETIEIAGTVAQMRSAFHTQIHQYAVRGEMHYANANDPQIPAALAPVVGGFFSLNNFRSRSYSKVLGKAGYDPHTGKAKPEWTIGPGSPASQNEYVLSPADFAVQYDLGKLYGSGITGAGQTIAIVNESNVNLDLVNQFRTLFLPGYPVNQTQVIVDGSDPGVDGINNFGGPNYASGEAYLDVEWAGAVAPNATIDLVIAADAALEDGLSLAMARAVYSNVAPVISLSFGECELNLGAANQSIASLWEQAAAQGITVIVSTGDDGSAGCDNDAGDYAVHGQAVSGYASTPFNVAVGGTDFYYSSYNQGESAVDAQLATYWNTTPSNSAPSASLLAPIPEQPWNDSQYGDNIVSYYNETGGQDTSIGAGSGGASNAALCSTAYSSNSSSCTGALSGYPKPAWQSTSIAGVPNDSVRDLPDVSLFAANGENDTFFPECAADGDCQPASSGGAVQITGVGGTSASAPAFAGIMALVNQATGSRQGQADFTLYPLSKQFPTAFNDVKVGTIAVPCEIAPSVRLNCIAVANPIVLDSGQSDAVTEGEIGSGTTAEYNAGAGYDLATGLGSIDAYNLVTNWSQVKFAATTTTLAPSASSFNHGTAITFSGGVTGNGAPTGDVALMTDSTEDSNQGQAFFTLNNGSFTSATGYPAGIGFLPGGEYHIWGQYSGDAINAASSSTPIEIIVNPEPSAIDLNMINFDLGTIYQPGAGPASPVDYGSELLLSAAVAPGLQAAALQNCLANNVGCSSLFFTVPTGVVTFTDTAGNTAIATPAALDIAGDAEFNAPFAVGTHAVTASYHGDNSYAPAASTAPITFSVAKDTPAVLLGYSSEAFTANPLNGTGQPTVITIVLENDAQFNSGFGSVPSPVSPPTGSVSITSTPAGLSGTATLSPAVDYFRRAAQSVATFTYPAGSESGSFSAKVTYSGDANYNSISANGSIILNSLASNKLQSTTAASIVNANTTITPNAPVVITGSVSGSGTAAPAGGVEIYTSGIVGPTAYFSSSTGNVSNFTAVLGSQSLVQGTNFVTVQFPGDSNYNPSAAIVNLAIHNPLSDFTMVPNRTLVPLAAGGSGTATINLGSVNGFAGAVNLSCSTSTVQCTVTPAVSLSSGGTGAATLMVNAPAVTADGTHAVMVTGKDAATGEFIHALGFQAIVATSTPGIALSNNGNITIAPGASTGNTSTISATPENGFTGTVNLSCLVTTTPLNATSPVTCNIPSPVDITGNNAVTAILSANSTATTTTGAYAITVTGTSGGLTATTVVSVTVNAAATPSFALSNGGGIAVTQGATSGNTSTITATPAGGFTGTVNLGCAVTTAPAGATSPVTCNVPSSVNITGTAAATATLTANSSASTTTGSYAITVTGSSGAALTSTTIVNVTVASGATPTFTLSATTPASVSPGASASSTITVNGSGGYAGSVALSCALTSSPGGASDLPTCAITSGSPVALSTGTSSGTAIASVTTTGASVGTLIRPGRNNGKGWMSAGSGAVFAFLVFLGMPARRRSWRAMLGLVALLACFGGLSACGGSLNGSGGGNSGTTAGIYTFTVTGAGSPTVTPAPGPATFTLTVN